MALDLDVAWLVGCAGLVFLMQPGFMCLESGLTRSKNNINVAIKNLTDFAISVIVFWLFSYSLMFGQSLWGWIGHGSLIPELTDSAKLAAFFLFQAMFCGTATTIVSGAVAERMRYKLYLVVCVVISGLIYPVFGHWAWNGIETGSLGGWLRSIGFIDFGGSTVVHSIGGWVSLAAILVVGPRAGRYARDGSFATLNHSDLPFSVLGAMLLWLGWLGFNGGSTLAFDEQIPRIIVQTLMAGTTGLLSAMALGWYRRKLPEVETTINGSLAGLVAITAGCHTVSTLHAVLIGAIAGLIMILATDLMNYLHLDDGVDAVAVHGFCGVWGTIAVALFGDLDKIGTGLSRHHQVAVQLLGVGVAFVWAFGLSYLLFRLINRISPLRVTPEEEELGLNVSEHGAKTELYDLFQVMDAQAATQDYSLRVPSAPYTEIGKIAHHYNQVMATVESYANRLRSFNTQLEEKVQQRTQEIAQANQELIRLSQVKDRFLANTSHELRTPLHGIVGLADSMLDGAAGELSPVQRENLAMIAHSGRRLANLVNDILDYSQLRQDAAQPGGASRMRLQRSRVQLHSIVALILTMSEVTIGKKNVILTNAVPADLPLLWVDVNRLQQILYNLVGNGIKFTPAGEVRVSAQLEAGATDYVSVLVADTGIGVPTAHQSRIFESFEQADGSMARQYGGSGLGLTVAKQLIELHGGRISVTSRVGEGSTFRFTMPVYDASRVPEHEPTPLFELGDGLGAIAPPSSTSPSTQHWMGTSISSEAASRDAASLNISETGDMTSNFLAVPQAATLAEANHRRFKILIVDDEPVNLQVLMNQLSLENYAIFQATSGMEALAEIERGFQPDLVLLDVMMPNMTGYEVCQRLRERFPATELPILMLTAKSQLADIVQGFQEGANDYLTKPIQKQELLARMRTHLHLSNLNLAYSRFVPQQFLRLLKKESILDVAMGDQVLQEMSILFSDIRNFTALSEQMTPQENFRFINRYFSYMEPAITENHGFIDKYIGDAIMALFAGGADDAVRAAIAMLQHLVIYNQARKEANQAPLEIGLGLNTGDLMLGTVGGQSRIDSTVIGDVVNVAARLEDLTKFYGVPCLISEFTRQRLQDPQQYDLRWIDQLQVRGRLEPIVVYEVFDADPQAMRDQKKLMQPLWEIAIACFQREDYEAAQEEFEAYLALLPQDPVAQLYTTRCREKQPFPSI